MTIDKNGIDNKELIRRVAARTDEGATVEAIVSATLEEIYGAIAQGESVTLRNFGKFYVRSAPDKWVFKFAPAQRLRQALGWSSTYKGDG